MLALVIYLPGQCCRCYWCNFLLCASKAKMVQHLLINFVLIFHDYFVWKMFSWNFVLLGTFCWYTTLLIASLLSSFKFNIIDRMHILLKNFLVGSFTLLRFLYNWICQCQVITRYLASKNSAHHFAIRVYPIGATQKINGLQLISP